MDIPSETDRRYCNIIRTLSKLGICSRKQALRWVQSGRVKVNGTTILDPGFKVRRRDRISVDGKAAAKQRNQYLLLHKPAGFLTTRQDEKGRKTVYDLLGPLQEWLFPVGRLDRDSEGLLLFTNDTELGERLTNPRNHVPRTYQVFITGRILPEDLKKIRQGVDLGRSERSRPAQAKILRQDAFSTALEITLTEGKNREIRRIFETLGKPVVRLIRTRFGPFHLASLKAGEWREIQPKSALFWDLPKGAGSQNPGHRTPLQSE